MKLRSLSAQDFRNFSSVKLQPGDGVNIFYGDNGSGKTNLIEAIFLLCLGRSHRGASDAVLVKSGSDCYRIEGRVDCAGKEIAASVAFQAGLRKKITVDKVPVRIASLYDTFCTVSVGPEDSQLLAGPPSARRAFIDVYLAQLSKNYLRNLTDYRKALVQKNAALKEGLDASAFNELMVSYGSVVIKARRDFLEGLGKSAGDFYSRISAGGSLSLAYEPSAGHVGDGSDDSAIEEGFRRKLERLQERERALQTSLVGPHRDEVNFEIEQQPARTHGSQGQWRTAAVALKLAVYGTLKRKRGVMPILLLDEIFAELDAGRTANLVEAFEDFGQLFLTTAVTPPEILKKQSHSFRINYGMVEDIG
ncbi:MAG: DNA replication/repair protein RecF [candidate division Zixibacteria bacterium]|nr:DNA replication/repair protein RecF [candidate division Zixibacteria bacterium]